MGTSRNKSKTKSRKSNASRELIIITLTILITPFYFAYRLLFALPNSCSPFLGLFRGAVYFAIICWLTSNDGNVFEYTASEYLSSFMSNTIAKFLVASIGGLCTIMFFVSVLILLGFHLGMEYHGDPRDLNGGAGHEYPNIHRAMRDFDKRLGAGTIHGLITLFKKINK